ncbi:uncharacterized protein LOC121871803 [Homarus americanus]|uniref:uncharacterized protein LOC121871803 n=1 Tax=Homarus americanus TaxID=6706 RepID=UPI001C45120D|nr:uncharacterized protein LOC121871803 [Homarus americanus]
MDISSQRRLARGRQRRKTGRQRTVGWLEEVTIEQCVSPQEDTDTLDDTEDDSDECHDSKTVMVADHREVNSKKAEDRYTKHAVHPSYTKNRHKQFQNLARRNSSSSYRPLLEVWRQRTGTSYPVDDKRTIICETKTILYGQTPTTMCKIQLKVMAEAAGLTLSEFSRLVLASSTKEHLLLLRQYHTLQLPQLTQLFDELDVCAPSVRQLKQTLHNEQNTENGNILSDETGSTYEAVAGPCKVSQNVRNESKIVKKCINTYNRNLRTGQRKAYAQTQTVRVSRKTFTKKVNVQEDNHQQVVNINYGNGEDQLVHLSSSKRFEATSIKETKVARTVISDTESDTSSNSERNCDLSDSDCIPPSPESNEEQEAQNFNIVKSPYCKILSQCTRMQDNCDVLLAPDPAAVLCTAGRIQDGQSKREKTAITSAEKLDSLNGQKNMASGITSEQPSKNSNFHYNSVLAGLLFEDESSTTCNKKSEIVNSGNLHRINLGKKEMCEKNTGMNTKPTGCYNRVLDTLLFGDCSPLPASEPKQSGEGTAHSSQTPTTTTVSQVYHSNSYTNHSMHIIDELFGSPQVLDGRSQEESAAGEGHRGIDLCHYLVN